MTDMSMQIDGSSDPTVKTFRRLRTRFTLTTLRTRDLVVRAAAAITGRQVAFAMVLGGGVLIGVGAGLIYAPAGLLAGGGLMIWFGLLVVPVGSKR
jgi:hypothetical protein